MFSKLLLLRSFLLILDSYLRNSVVLADFI